MRPTTTKDFTVMSSLSHTHSQADSLDLPERRLDHEAHFPWRKYAGWGSDLQRKAPNLLSQAVAFSGCEEEEEDVSPAVVCLAPVKTKPVPVVAGVGTSRNILLIIMFILLCQKRTGTTSTGDHWRS